MVEKKTSSCGACQIATPRTTREPLQMSPLHASLWRQVSVDFKQLSSCEYLLVISDDYSRYPVVEPVRSTSASTVIPQLDKTFSTFGIPEIVRSDSCPPFNGRKFREFAQTFVFSHGKVTPLWPRANGQVERFMRTIKTSVAAAKAEGKPWKTTLPTAKELSVDTTLLNRNRPAPQRLCSIARCGTSFQMCHNQSTSQQTTRRVILIKLK